MSQSGKGCSFRCCRLLLLDIYSAAILLIVVLLSFVLHISVYIVALLHELNARYSRNLCYFFGIFKELYICLETCVVTSN